MDKKVAFTLFYHSYSSAQVFIVVIQTHVTCPLKEPLTSAHPLPRTQDNKVWTWLLEVEDLVVGPWAVEIVHRAERHNRLVLKRKMSIHIWTLINSWSSLVQWYEQQNHPSIKPKKLANIWPTFVGKFVAKNFQKSPNLVTLDRTKEKKFGK